VSNDNKWGDTEEIRRSGARWDDMLASRSCFRGKNAFWVDPNPEKAMSNDNIVLLSFRRREEM